jgi:capsular polysaccharide biosynthesis protein
MHSPVPSRPSSEPFAVRVYRFGLRLYPEAYRRRFGPEMEQLFRDQWRDARASGSLGGFVGLLFRTVADLILTAGCQRILALRRGLGARETLTPVARLGWSLGAGFPVALLVVGLTVAVTFAMPATYRSESRVLVRHVVAAPEHGSAGADPFVLAREAEVAVSLEVLARVVERLALAERWAGERSPGRLLSSAEAVAMLRDRVTVRQVRNTAILEVAVYDADRELAADIANAITEAYVVVRGTAPSGTSSPEVGDVASRVGASIIDPAEAGLRPVRPNVPLNIFVGLLVGGMVGLVVSAAVWVRLRRGIAGAGPASPA